MAGSMFKLPSAKKLRGNVDLASPTQIAGWVMHRADPQHRAGVELRVESRIVAAAKADRFRSDLLAAGIGDGRYGFEIAVPPGLTAQDWAALRVVEVSTGREFSVLPPREMLAEEAVTAMQADPPADPYASLLEALLDRDFYAAQFPDSGLVPPKPDDFLAHYRKTGWKAGLNPHPLFDTGYYLAQDEDELDTDPLTHFVRSGQFGYRPTHPLLDIAYYHANRQDVLAAGMHPLVHYVASGAEEKVPTSPLFDAAHYNHQLEDDALETTPILHYLAFGWREGLKPHPNFDPPLFRRLAGLKPGVEPYTAFLAAAEARAAAPAKAPAAPLFSFIVLNLNKAVLTLQCLHFLARNTDLSQAEIVIVDNGSGWDEFAILCKLAVGAKIVRVERNVGFGEGNNLGVEAASGRHLVFLNNDAFVCEGWLPPLAAAIEEPGVGAAGPKFLFPDGTLQEAGVTISSCGTPCQRGKDLNARDDALFNERMDVDYCSAAALMVRADSFRRVLGFDLCWDPAYYEDVDLCLKLRLIGERTVYVPGSEVVHLEHQTANDRSIIRMDGLVLVNRAKFVARWSRFLSGRSDGTAERRLLPEFAPNRPEPVPAGPRPRLALYSPFPLTPGGGERYLLSLAAALRGEYDCTLLTYDSYSALRLATLARELELPLDHVEILQRKATRRQSFDVFVCMSNEILPNVAGLGRLNLFLCQFPFAMPLGVYGQNWGNLAGYDAVLVYSRFVADHVARAAGELALPLPPVHVLCPAIPQVAPVPERERTAEGPFRIVNVGRFTPAGHCKRQDVMIEAFRGVVAASRRPLELHLAGAVSDQGRDRTYLTSLQRAARGLPVSFHVNAPAEDIHDLYRRASVYWHMTGAKDDVRHMPERFEHFGITIGEAMSAGAIPISLRHGGPGEIIREGVDGFLVSDAAELRDRTLATMEGGESVVGGLREAARRRSRDFSAERFGAHLRAILADPRTPTIDPALR